MGEANKRTLPPCHNPKVPVPEIGFKHFIDLQIRFGDIDVFGHVNNGAFLAMLDLAKARYFAEATSLTMRAEEIQAVVVNINCSFYSPAYFEEPLTAATAVSHIGEKSLRLEQRLFNRQTGDVKCVAQTVLAGFDPKTASSAPISVKLREKIEEFEGS